MTPKRRSRKLRRLEKNKEKRFKLVSILSPNRNCFMVTQCSSATARKNRVILYLLRFIAVASGGYKTDFNLSNIIATLCLLFPSVKNSPFFFIYFQAFEFSRSALGCHENSDPGKQIKKKDLSSSQSYYLKCFMVTQCS